MLWESLNRKKNAINFADSCANCNFVIYDQKTRIQINFFVSEHNFLQNCQLSV